MRSVGLTSLRLNWGEGKGDVHLRHTLLLGNIKVLLEKPRVK